MTGIPQYGTGRHEDYLSQQDERRAASDPAPGSPWPCCQHCIDGDGMLPCGQVHDEPCGTGDCGLVTDAELARWRKGLQL
jgi:hypothetical protein